MTIDRSLDCAYKTIAIAVATPLVVKNLIVLFLDLPDYYFTIFCFACSFAATIILNSSLNKEYDDVYKNSVQFIVALLFSGLVLFIIRDMLQMGILSVIMTLTGMVFAYFHIFGAIISFIKGARSI